MIISILEGHVTSERWNDLTKIYRDKIRHVPVELKESFLIQDVKDRTLWRIIMEWKSREDYERLKDSKKLAACADIFREVSVEPSQRVFEVVEKHTTV